MKNRLRVVIAILGIAGWITQERVWAAEKLTPEAIFKQHLAAVLGDSSVATLQAARLITGISAMKILDGGTGLVKGSAEFRTDGTSALLQLKFESQGYPQDGFRLREDGTVLPIEVSPGSAGFLAGFIDSYRYIVRSGLFGSVLSAAWPPAHENMGLTKMAYKGEKKVEKDKLHLIECEFEAGMKSDLYFEPGTFRHVRSVHRIPPDRGNAFLTEEFLGFQRVAGIEMPSLWRLTVEWRGNRRILYEIGLQNLQSPPPSE
ncbi:MAG: hypothetical protein Kow001_04930 [Acidobacteriota bacterium]